MIQKEQFEKLFLRFIDANLAYPKEMLEEINGVNGLDRWWCEFERHAHKFSPDTLEVVGSVIIDGGKFPNIAMLVDALSRCPENIDDYALCAYIYVGSKILQPTEERWRIDEVSCRTLLKSDSLRLFLDRHHRQFTRVDFETHRPEWNRIFKSEWQKWAAGETVGLPHYRIITTNPELGACFHFVHAEKLPRNGITLEKFKAIQGPYTRLSEGEHIHDVNLKLGGLNQMQLPGAVKPKQERSLVDRFLDLKKFAPGPA
jgi:hypothetical protein